MELIAALPILILIVNGLFSPGKMMSRGDLRTGGLIFEYSRKKKLSVLAGLWFIAVTIAYFALRGDYERLELFAPVVLVGAYVLMMSYEALSILSKTIKLSSTGVEQKSFLGSTAVNWHEVSSIERRARRGRRFTVKGAGGKIHLNDAEVEIDSVARAIMEYVPSEKRRHIEQELKNIISWYGLRHQEGPVDFFEDSTYGLRS